MVPYIDIVFYFILFYPGRCVSGTNKGKEGWFPLSLCFGIPQDKSSFVFELSKSVSPGKLFIKYYHNYVKYKVCIHFNTKGII
jgi:hypothetical protein